MTYDILLGSQECQILSDMTYMSGLLGLVEYQLCENQKIHLQTELFFENQGPKSMRDQQSTNLEHWHIFDVIKLQQIQFHSPHTCI